MADYNVPESCRGASGMPWNLPERPCSKCGRLDSEGDNCDVCHKFFCEECSYDREVLFYGGPGCWGPHCAECSDSFRGLLGMLTELRAEVKLLEDALKRALLEMGRLRVADAARKQFIETMGRLTTSPR